MRTRRHNVTTHVYACTLHPHEVPLMCYSFLTPAPCDIVLCSGKGCRLKPAHMQHNPQLTYTHTADGCDCCATLCCSLVIGHTDQHAEALAAMGTGCCCDADRHHNNTGGTASTTIMFPPVALNGRRMLHKSSSTARYAALSRPDMQQNVKLHHIQKAGGTSAAAVAAGVSLT